MDSEGGKGVRRGTGQHFGTAAQHLAGTASDTGRWDTVKVEDDKRIDGRKLVEFHNVIVSVYEMARLHEIPIHQPSPVVVVNLRPAGDGQVRE